MNFRTKYWDEKLKYCEHNDNISNLIKDALIFDIGLAVIPITHTQTYTLTLYLMINPD